MARLARRAGCLVVAVLLIAAAYLGSRDYVRRYPQNVPWTALDLNDPIGHFSGRKLAALTGDRASCLALLGDAGAPGVAAPRRSGDGQCSYLDGVRLAGEGTRIAPAGLVTSCPVAAALFVWERDVLQRAALRHFGVALASIEHAGSYSCRRLYGRATGDYSEHATADAIDVTGFRMVDGTRVRVLQDWRTNGPKAAFLREVRDGSCALFATVLSPEYNEAHADHFHLDQAERGAMGWRVCR